MAKASKVKSGWRCQECSATTNQWYGRCPACGAWNTVVEELAAPTRGDRPQLSNKVGGEVVSLARAETVHASLTRLSTGSTELDRVLGGGLVPGSIVLLGGAPGIGKSTLILQACGGLVAGLRAGGERRRVLYASGEESVAQLAGRARRLSLAKAADESLMLMAETRIEAILAAADEHQPAAVVVDSIQTVYSDAQDGLPGNLGQIRSVTGHLMSWAKTRGCPVLVVGHVTKDGQLAGPRLLEHMVDTVLSFEGDDERAVRMLRATKNRFGSTQELGVFEMRSSGLVEIKNPSEAFLGDRSGAGTESVGSCVAATLEGSRPLLVELQALLGPSPGGSPRRTCVGADSSRLAMMLAVLDRHGRLGALEPKPAPVPTQDVFVNVVGGLRLVEPAADLPLCIALVSSAVGRPVGLRTLAIGEVGLTGELRRVPRLEARLAEAARLGFDRAVVPKASKKTKIPKSLRVASVASVAEAVDLVFGSRR